ncbi:MAG: hypothetical protein ACKOW8_11670, partial [Flavobacteriales bacterium]
CEWIWDDQNLSRSYVKFSPFIDMSGNAMILRHNPKGWLNAYCLSMKWRMDQLFKSNINYLDYSGGYKFLERNELDSLLRTIVMGEANHGENLPMAVCDMNQFYLRKMIQLLKDNNCMVYLIRSPLHSLYPGYKNEMDYHSIYSRHFSDVEKLDFSKFPLTNDDYGDFEHLNHNGARKFSIAFNDMILQGLLSYTNKQQFIDEYFAAMD